LVTLNAERDLVSWVEHMSESQSPQVATLQSAANMAQLTRKIGCSQTRRFLWDSVPVSLRSFPRSFSVAAHSSGTKSIPRRIVLAFRDPTNH